MWDTTSQNTPCVTAFIVNLSGNFFTKYLHDLLLSLSGTGHMLLTMLLMVLRSQINNPTTLFLAAQFVLCSSRHGARLAGSKFKT